jgi:phosphatidylserine decarboxylase
VRSPDSTHEELRNLTTSRVGHWLPADHRSQKDWLEQIIEKVEKSPTAPQDLHPVIQEFQQFIENNTRIYLLFHNMFDEIPSKKPYNNDPTGAHKQVRDYQHMLQLLNHILTTAPSWNDKEHRVGMVGVPMQAIFDWPMGTPSGFAVFQDPDVNAMLKKVLCAWGEYLESPASAYVLGSESQCWFSEHGTHDLTTVANVGQTNHAFEDLFQCDPSKQYKGYKSWDDFFTRLFRDDVRPVASPENDSIIANACESTPYNTAYNVAARDRFWIKGQPYSVFDMLAQDPLHPQFIGGTVYQAFLSALSYHRWHAPVSGRIVKAYNVPGTYFSEPLFEGLGDPESHEIDSTSESTGQGYLTAMATRAIIFIESANPAIGLVAFMGIGMTEVSSCQITVIEGQEVQKGDQIGMFHYGGSTYCLLFRKGVDVSGFPEPGGENNVPVRGKLAVVKGGKTD